MFEAIHNHAAHPPLQTANPPLRPADGRFGRRAAAGFAPSPSHNCLPPPLPPLQFNVASWLDSYGPSLAERSQMLDFISQGLTLCGPKPSQEGNMLVEVSTTVDSRVEDRDWKCV